MSEARKKSASEKAMDKTVAKARAKAIEAIREYRGCLLALETMRGGTEVPIEDALATMVAEADAS